MTASVRIRPCRVFAAAVLALGAVPALAQEDPQWSAPSYREHQLAPRNDGYSPATGGATAPRYSANDAYAPGGDYGSGGDAYSPNRDSYDSYDSYGSSGNGDAYSPSRGGYGGAGDAYSRGNGGGSGYGDAYSPSRASRNDSFSDPGEPSGGGYGAPYAPPPDSAPYDQGPPPPREGRYYEQNEIIAEGHSFFGAVSHSLASAVEYVFKSQGRPNGYILGEDAGGAFVVGLRYGEGRLYTKDAGDYKVYWQGPSLGYDWGGEGSKTMVLVYNLHDPSDIYNRFGGVQGAAYLVGGVSVQFQTYGDVKLAVIRSGVGLRLGANVGYLKYTRAPTWNPL